MFGNGNYATIKSVKQAADSNGTPKNVYECKLVTSKRDPHTKTYKTDFVSNFVGFYGKAFEKHPVAGQRIKLLNSGTQNCWVNDQNEIIFYKSPRYLVFDYELLEEGRGEKPDIQESEFSGEGFLPF